MQYDKIEQSGRMVVFKKKPTKIPSIDLIKKIYIWVTCNNRRL